MEPKLTVVVARGDSQLITSFMQRRAKPGQPTLVDIVADIKESAKQFKFVHYQHVPREGNKWANYLTRVALSKQSCGNILDGAQVQ